MNPYKDVEENSFTTNFTYEDIATKLLKDHYFLTALELHTELVECGKELPQLREFFSNPGNFEQHVSRASDLSSMHRSPSQATLDSLDTARYSEDGGGDRGGSGGDIAVLEFELRKARETINALRANLTQFADGESTLDKSTKGVSNQRTLKPHEKRALNFLINEYLLLQDYKLTSITFSDENPEQEFEDWDDVGLNMPRPAGLVSLFWGTSGPMNVPTVDASTEMDWQFVDVICQTEFDEGNDCVSCDTLGTETDWSHELLIQAEEIELLKQKIIALETEKLNFQKLYDAAIVSLNSLTSPNSESKECLDLNIPEEKLLTVQAKIDPLEARPLTCTAAENHYGSGNSTHSATPEQFEIIDGEKNCALARKDGSNTSSYDPAVLDSVRDSPVGLGSVTTLDETMSINDAGEWTRVHYEYNTLENNNNKEMWIDSGLPNKLKMTILNWCCETLNLNEPLTNELLAELVNSDKPITMQGLLALVADTLPRILAHTLVARRSEAVALLAGCAALAPPADPRRARTLHALLTLVKRPDAHDTRAICEATCLIVKWGGSGEVLSSVAELLASKSAERRLLASQICLAVAPYVPIELCTSLLLSLVMMMCESHELEVRSMGLKAACLICPVAEHKYAQLENLVFNFLKDPVENIVKDTVANFTPVLARSALVAGKFSTDLCPRIMTNLSKAKGESEWRNVVLYLNVLRELVLAKVAYVMNVQIVRDAAHAGCEVPVALQEVPLEDHEIAIDLQCYITDGADAKVFLACMNNLINEKPDVRWTELNWFINLMKQILEHAVSCKVLHQATVYELLISLFSSYIENFGIPFSEHILRPIFTEAIVDLEQKMEKLHTVNVDSAGVVGVYLVTVLATLDDRTQHAEFLQKWVVYSTIRGLPVSMLAVPLKWVAEHKPDTLDFYLQHLREFSASSCESSSGSSIRVYIAELIAELLGTADIPEECVDKQLLPAVEALLHDDDESVCEAAVGTWESLCVVCVSRRWAGEARCWAALRRAALGRAARPAARAARALAGLLAAPPAPHATEQAVSLVCALCEECGPWGECVAALAAGLRLALVHGPHHPALLPAIRKLEEIVQAPSLGEYRGVVEALAQSSVGGEGRAVSHAGVEVGSVGSEEGPAQRVGRRVTQMFQQSKTNINLPNIFKKKT